MLQHGRIQKVGDIVLGVDCVNFDMDVTAFEPFPGCKVKLTALLHCPRSHNSPTLKRTINLKAGCGTSVNFRISHSPSPFAALIRPPFSLCCSSVLVTHVLAACVSRVLPSISLSLSLSLTHTHKS